MKNKQIKQFQQIEENRKNAAKRQLAEYEAKAKLKVFTQINRKVYAYTTPDYAPHNGMIKIGDTMQAVEHRIDEQSKTIDVKTRLEWYVPAVKKDGTPFRDYDFHAYLKARGVARVKDREWFYDFGGNPITASRKIMSDFINGVPADAGTNALEYKLRDEQQIAVDKMKNYFENGGTEFLLNAKPRFGKTLTMYDLTKAMDLDNVLILTNRPAIANSWLSDYMSFVTSSEGRHFVSTSSALAGKLGVKTPADFADIDDENKQQIAFISLQDLKGSSFFGGNFDKLEWVADTAWDLVIFDEAHEARDTQLTQVAISMLNKKYTVALSGTPFKMLNSGEFTDENTVNWTYPDEQQVKFIEIEHNMRVEAEGSSESKQTDHITLPTMILHSHKMSDSMVKKIQEGVLVADKLLAPVVTIKQLFETKNETSFLYEEAVDDFLDEITSSKDQPFSTMESQDSFAHTFWLVPSIEAAKLLAKKIKNHPVLRQYFPIVAAGDTAKNNDFTGDNGETKALDLVKKAIKTHDKTITLSVGQLTTGVTVKEWNAVLFLTKVDSPELYMQTASRCQNPYSYSIGEEIYDKELCHVFDYSQLSTYDVVDKFMQSEGGSTTSDEETYKMNLGRILNTLFVFSEDDNGEMVRLNVNNFMEMKLKARRVEIKRNGFGSSLMFSKALVNPSDELIEALMSLDMGEQIVKNTRKKFSKPAKREQKGAPANEVVYENAIKRLSNTLNQFDFAEDSFAKFNEAVDEINDLEIPNVSQAKITNGINSIANTVSDTIEMECKQLELSIKYATRKIDEQIEAAHSMGHNVQFLDEVKAKRIDELTQAFNDNIQGTINAKIEAEKLETIAFLERGQANFQKREEESIIKNLISRFSEALPGLVSMYANMGITTIDTLIEAVDDEITDEMFGINKEQFTTIMSNINEEIFNFTVKEFF